MVPRGARDATIRERHVARLDRSGDAAAKITTVDALERYLDDERGAGQAVQHTVAADRARKLPSRVQQPNADSLDGWECERSGSC